MDGSRGTEPSVAEREVLGEVAKREAVRTVPFSADVRDDGVLVGKGSAVVVPTDRTADLANVVGEKQEFDEHGGLEVDVVVGMGEAMALLHDPNYRFVVRVVHGSPEFEFVLWIGVGVGSVEAEMYEDRICSGIAGVCAADVVDD